MICPHCRNEVADGNFCSVCGRSILAAPVPNPFRSEPEPAPTLPPKRPKTYLISSILATLCCCLPLGIVAIVYAARVDSLYDRGDYEGALHSSKMARNFCNLSAIAVVLIVLGYVGLCVLGALGRSY